MNKKLEIKFATKEDLYFIRKMYSQLDTEMENMLPEFIKGSDDEEHSDDYWLDIINKKTGFILIAILDGVNVGMSVVESQGQDTCHLEDLIIVNEFRRYGIGRALVEKSKCEAKNSGNKYMSLNVLDKNKSAELLYEKQGFEKIKTVMMSEL